MIEPSEHDAAAPAADSAERRKRPVVPLVIGAVGLAAVALGVIFGPRLIESQTSPTPACIQPTLAIGSAKYRIEPTKPASDGTLNIPADMPGVAYQVEGAGGHLVFALSPVAENLALSTAIAVADKAIITQANCNAATYAVSAVSPGSPGLAALTGPSASALTVFVGGGAGGFTLAADLIGEEIVAVNTPDPAAREIQAEISLLQTNPSADGKSVQAQVAVLNYGARAATLTAGDVALTLPDGTMSVLTASDPTLPARIGPGSTVTFTLTFERPSVPAATLKILGVEYELEGY